MNQKSYVRSESGRAVDHYAASRERAKALTSLIVHSAFIPFIVNTSFSTQTDETIIQIKEVVSDYK